jgi:2-haloacid dehalogenase
MESWVPFPEVPDALRRIGRKRKIAILSNVDDTIIEKTLPRIGVPIDKVLTAEHVQSYKPGARHFEEGQRLMGVPSSMILHAAFGWEYDIGPATAAGYRTCFVNRSGRVPPTPTDFVVKDLDELAKVLE